MKNLIILVNLFLFPNLYASWQYGDLLIIENDTIEIYNLPLESYLEKNKKNILFQLNNTSLDILEANGEIEPDYYPNFHCHRGYVATWKIINNQLYLIDYVNCSPFKSLNDKYYVLKNFFPKQENLSKIPAFWFKGNINIPKDPNEFYWDGTNESIYGNIIRYSFKKGKLIDKEELINPNPIKQKK